MKPSTIALCTLAGASPLASAHGSDSQQNFLFHLFTSADHVTVLALLAVTGSLALTRPAMRAVLQKKR